MTTNTPDVTNDETRFPSLEALRAAHSELLKRSRVQDSTPELIAEIESFVVRGKATGALLDAEADRWAAQGQLDYWTTQLFRPDYVPPDATLDEFNPLLAPELDNAACPYMGLDAFREPNRNVFFGRERLIAELVGKLSETSLLAIVGPSGSGKSSIVRAGMVPLLREGALPNSEDWFYFAPMVPGSQPLANLARIILPAGSSTAEIQTEANRMLQDGGRLKTVIEERTRQTASLLIVDQFEEVYSLCTDKSLRRMFIQNLVELCRQSSPQHRVVITLRTDFESFMVRSPDLDSLFEQGLVRVTPLNANELRQSIEKPAAQVGLRFEQGVVEALLQDTLGEPAALPLLQFTLLRLWEGRERNRVTWAAYRRLEGGRLALAKTADDFYVKLILEEQVTVRRILLKMVTLGEGLEVTSKRIPRTLLYHKAEAVDRIDRVLEKLIKTRLVRFSEGDLAIDEQVEVAHEALVRNWPRFIEWLEQDQDNLRVRKSIDEATQSWLAYNKDQAELLRGARLTEARAWMAHNLDELTSAEIEFLNTSVEYEEAEAFKQKDYIWAETLLDVFEALNNASDTGSLLDRILANVHRVVSHDFAMIMLIDQTHIAHLVRSHGQAADEINASGSSIRFPLNTTNFLQHMADTGQPLIIADVYEWPGWIVLPGMDWARAYLGAPIIIKGEIAGFIGLNTAARGFFTAEHAKRLQSFARQAALALENAQLFEAEREQSDLAEALRDTAGALNRTLDIDEVFDRILANTARVVPYDSVNIMLLDEARQMAEVVRQLGYAQRGLEEWVKQLRFPINTTPGFRHMATTGQPYLVSDTREQADWVSFPETRWQRAFVGMPVQIDGQVVGFLNLDSATPHFFTAEHVVRLRAFAEQIANAVRNARLYAASHRNVQRLTRLYEASLDLAQADSPAKLYQQLLRAAIRLIEADASTLGLYDGEQHLVITAVENFPQDLISERVQLGHSLSGRAATTRQIQQTADYAHSSDREPIMNGLPIVALVAVPLLWHDRLVGTLSISDRRVRVFEEDDLHTLTLFGTLAAAAIEQGRALNEAQVRETEARLLSSRLAGAQDEERSRIAAFLHDAVGGQLVLLQKNTEQLQIGFASSEATLQLLSSNLNLLHQVHRQVRSLASDLDSRVLTDLGLVPAIRQYLERLRASTRLPIQLHITGHQRRLSAEIERVAFRSVQEAVANVLRYAQATEISTQLHMGGRALRLTVQDNGRGFDPASMPPGTELGLPEIKRQVEALRGEFFLETTPGSGTLLAVQIPIYTGAADHARAGVLIVDDHELLRRGLRQLITATDDFMCVGEAADTPEALRQIELTQPTIIVMDVKLPGGSGIEATRQIMRRFPTSRVIIYTYHADETYLEQAMQAGAKGYLLKSDHSRLILTALRSVLAGDMYIAPALTEAWARLQLRPATTEPIELLSVRERQVLQAVALGKPNLEIAEELGISARSVEVHRRNILDKLGYRNVAQLVKFAIDYNLI